MKQEDNKYKEVSAEWILQKISSGIKKINEVYVVDQIDFSVLEQGINDLTFEHCHFESDLSFDEVQIKRLSAINCFFNGDVYFDYTIVATIRLQSSTFNRMISFDEATITRSAKIINCHVNRMLSFYKLTLKDNGQIVIKYSGIDSLLSFDEATCGRASKIELNRVKLNGIDFSKGEYSKIKIQDSESIESIDCSESRVLVDFDMSYSNIKGNLLFKGSIMNEIGLLENIIGDSVDVSISTLTSCYIDNCNIQKDTFFDDVRDLTDLTCLSNIFNGGLYLNGVNKDGIIKKSNISLESNIFKSQFFFNESCIDHLSIHGCIFSAANFHYSEINTGDRDTFRAIKNVYLKANDKVEALYYHSREMEELWKDSQPWIDQKEGILQNIKYVFDWVSFDLGTWFVLFFNKYSNYFGTNWIRGVFFTLVIAFSFFSLKMWVLGRSICFEDGCINEYLSGVLNFLYPLRSIHTPVADISYWIFVIDILGRVFVSYGIYQTVAAFRKYK